MEKTENNKLLDFQKKVGAIAKDSLNPFFKKNYFDINGLIAEIKPILNEVGLTLTQPISLEFDVTSRTGRSILHTFLKDGKDIIESSSISLPENLDPQKMGSAITYYRRYSIQSMLLLQAEDDDGNKASHKVTTEPNPFVEMQNAKSIEDIKRIWNANKPLQSDSAFLGLSAKRKSELTPVIMTPDTNNLMTKTDLDKLQPHPLNEPEIISVDDILPDGIGEVAEVEIKSFVKDTIADLQRCKTVTGMNAKFREVRGMAAYMFLDDSEKNQITEFCKTKKAELNEKK